MKSFDIIVIGGGVVGASTFHRLVSEGFSVVLIEKDRICQGTTAYSGGIVRCFHKQSQLSDMAVIGYDYYRNFEENTGIDCPFTESGFLYFDDISMEKDHQREVARLSENIEIKWLNTHDARSQFPYLKLSDNQGVVYEPKAGYMDTYNTTKGWVQAGEAAGGTVLEGVKVEKLISMHGRFVGVQTSIGPIYGERSVICTGALTTPLLASAGLDTDIYAQAIQVNRFHTDSFPDSHPAYIDDEFNLNGRPDGRGTMLAGHPTNDRIFVDKKLSIDLTHTYLITDFSRKRFEWAKNLEMRGGFKCFDSYTLDGAGEVKFVDEKELITVASGFSGGGFKLAPAIAAKVSQLLA